jgi:hypothetical protein
MALKLAVSAWYIKKVTKQARISARLSVEKNNRLILRVITRLYYIRVRAPIYYLVYSRLLLLLFYY